MHDRRYAIDASKAQRRTEMKPRHRHETASGRPSTGTCASGVVGNRSSSVRQNKIIVLGSGADWGPRSSAPWRAAASGARPERQLLDIGDFDAVRETLRAQEFDALVNCARSDQRRLLRNPSREAHRSTARPSPRSPTPAPASGRAAFTSATDYVFEGGKETPYTRSMKRGRSASMAPPNSPGRSFSTGFRPASCRVRVSWVFEPSAQLVDRFSSARSKTTAWPRSPQDRRADLTLDAAELLRPLLEAVPAGGVLHLCNTGACTWQEYGQFALDTAAAAGIPCGRGSSPRRAHGRSASLHRETPAQHRDEHRPLDLADQCHAPAVAGSGGRICADGVGTRAPVRKLEIRSEFEGGEGRRRML